MEMKTETVERFKLSLDLSEAKCLSRLKETWVLVFEEAIQERGADALLALIPSTDELDGLGQIHRDMNSQNDSVRVSFGEPIMTIEMTLEQAIELKLLIQNGEEGEPLVLRSFRDKLWDLLPDFVE